MYRKLQLIYRLYRYGASKLVASTIKRQLYVFKHSIWINLFSNKYNVRTLPDHSKLNSLFYFRKMILSTIPGSKQALVLVQTAPHYPLMWRILYIVMFSPGDCICLAHPHVWMLVVGASCLHAHNFLIVHQTCTLLWHYLIHLMNAYSL